MRKINTIGILAAIAIIALWYYAVGCDWRNNLDTLFSGLAFIGIIYSIYFQANELKITHKDLERSANAHEKSQDELAKQIKIMNKSAVLSGYTALLHYHDAQHKYLANLGKHEHAAKHREKADHAAKRIDDLTRDIETGI